MVYLKSLFVRASIWTTILMVGVVLDVSIDVEAGTMKIAYKKGIYGKPNVVKEKRYNIRSGVIRELPSISSSTRPSPTSSSMITDLSKATSSNANISASPSMSPNSHMSTTTNTTMPSKPLHALAPTEAINTHEPTPPMPADAAQKELHELTADNKSDTIEVAATIHPQDLEKLLVEDDDALRQYLVLNRLIDGTSATADALPHIKPLLNNTLEEAAQESSLKEILIDPELDQNVKAEKTDDAIEELFPLPEPEALIAPRRVVTPTKATSKKVVKTTATTESNHPVPCTCGIFLTSQFKRGTGEQPQGTPVITNELDRTFACNSVGQKQCQTKCLETLVQHLPNSATILCASMNRDCRKERAYLFIKNCRNHWVHTNLAAGREYCCRDGKPYNCPLV
ncbi:uncharacterized protein Fcp3C [Eurosta solidaginis]|uniref:uncharacterized protein Fcp3C n=1 Tax=Eurosta solidaginis TaxID=178769 RepID=UPI003530CF63